MKKTLIDKKFLNNYKTLSVVLENCDVYIIDVQDVLDIFCEAKLINENGKEYRTTDGFIKISARASQTKEYSTLRYPETCTDWNYSLKERLEMLDSGADMTSFSLKDKNNRAISIYVPYNPLEDVLYGSEIELSNCPSFETDEDGNMIIAFGERSKQPKRKDNNYAELIEGWKDAFGEYQPKVLKVKADTLSTFGDNQTNISFCFKICNKNSKKSFAELIFMDCKNISADMYFPNKRNCEIVMSKMEDGYIYVGIGGLGVDFICSSVLEYDHYCKQSEE